MKYILIALLFTSCVTQRKVNDWLGAHPTEAAGYCTLTYPPDTTAQIIFTAPDSTGFKKATGKLTGYADSLFKRLDSMQKVKPVPGAPCPPVINLDSLHKEVNAQIQRGLKPCVDSVVTIRTTVVDHAKEVYLTGKLEEKDKTISARDKTITDLTAQVKAKGKWVWYFWILAALCGLYTLLKIRKIIPF